MDELPKIGDFLRYTGDKYYPAFSSNIDYEKNIVLEVIGIDEDDNRRCKVVESENKDFFCLGDIITIRTGLWEYSIDEEYLNKRKIELLIKELE